MSIYGATVASDGNNNCSIGKFSPDQRCSMRERIDHTGSLINVKAYVKIGAGYSAGTGGTLILEIQTDDGTSSHRPSGSILATQTITPGNSGSGQVGTWTLASPLTVTSGQLLHFVFRNGDGAPITNYVSINGLDLQDRLPNPLQPGVSDLDRAFMIGDGSGLASYVLDREHYPIIDLEFADGYRGGQGYYEARSVSGQMSINGTQNKVRQNFTPSAARTVTSVTLYAYKQSGTTQPMIVKLQNSSGAQLATVTMPLSDFHQGNTGSGYGARYVTGTLDVPVALSVGSQYFLELSSPGEVNPYITFPTETRGGSTFGVAFQAANGFTDGYVESTTNGGGLWSTFSASTAWKLQAYFTESTPNPFTPPFTPKAWLDFSTGGTPITAAALIDLETRTTAYTDQAFSASGINISSGNGSPESQVSGSVGDLYARKDGGAGSTLYVKESGTATTTGWIAK